MEQTRNLTTTVAENGVGAPIATAAAGGPAVANPPAVHALPILVGVVGHRDLVESDVPELEEIVRSIIAGLRRDYPHTPITVLSPLAEGADRLVARVGLSMGARLVVPLPMRQDLYEQDFTAPGSIEEFRALLDLAAETEVMPVMTGYNEASISRPGTARDMHYAQVGAYVARHSQVLLALWNGVDSNVHGGTADVVHFRLRGIPAPYAATRSLLDPSENGALIQIVTRRQSTPDLVGEPLSVVHRYPDGFSSDKHARSAYDHILERIDAYNADAERLGASLASTRDQSREWLVPAPVVASLPRSLDALLDRYTMTDALAIHYQKRTLGAIVALFLLVFGAVFFFEVYSHLLPDEHWLLGSYLAVLGVTWLYNGRIRRGEFQTKYLDYRAIAEGLRVQFFWTAAGLSDHVADFYMQKQRTVLDWIRQSIRTWTMRLDEGASGDAIVREERLRIAQKHWVEDQAKYFPRAAHGLHAKLHRYEHWVDWFFGGAIAVAILQFFAHDFLHHSLHLGHGPLITIGVLLLCAGMMHGYIQKRALSELSKQYERMATMFVNASEHMDRLLNERHHNAAAELLRDLGKEALVENGDWLLLHRERPVEMPRGG